MTRINSEQAELALEIIEKDLGPSTATLARYLVASGPCTMDKAVEGCGVAPKRAQVALSSLFQHNLLIPIRSNDAETTRYALSLPRAFLRCAATFFFQQARKHFGEMGEVVTSLFIEHGRLSITALRGLLAIRFPTESSSSVFQETTHNMIKDKFLQPCQAAGDFNTVTIDPDDEPLFKRIKADASPRSVPEGETVYRISIFQFLYSLRLEAVYDHVKSRLHNMDPALKVVQELLRQDASPISFEETATRLPHFTSKTTFVNAATLEKKLKIGEALPSSLSALQAENWPIVNASHVSMGKPMFAIDTRQICNDLKTRQVESVLYRKFDMAGLRIYRTLRNQHHSGLLEEKSLGEMCMLPPDVVRMKLYSLLDEGFVQVQQVTRLAKEDRNPSEMYYLWSVPEFEKAPMEKVVRASYKALHIMIVRLRAAVDPTKHMPLTEEESRRLSTAILGLVKMILIVEIY